MRRFSRVRGMGEESPSLSATQSPKLLELQLNLQNKAFRKHPVVHRSGHTVVFRMIKPWKNPRSEVWWFRRRVPKEYLRFGMPAEIKFSLGTKDLREAEILCQKRTSGWSANGAPKEAAAKKSSARPQRKSA